MYLEEASVALHASSGVEDVGVGACVTRLADGLTRHVIERSRAAG